MTSYNSLRIDIVLLKQHIIDFKKALKSLYSMSNNELDKAKALYSDAKSKDIYFDLYRKDKLLKNHFIEPANMVLVAIDNFEKIQNEPNLIIIDDTIEYFIDNHYNALQLNKEELTNADTHYSLNGKKLLIDNVDIEFLQSIREKINRRY